MNDTQIKTNGTLTGIPVISPLLHCAAIPIVVFLRFNFGFLYLGPKAFFFPMILLGAASSLLASRFPSFFDSARALISFYIVSTILYLLHLAVAFCSQWARSAEHDRYSGTSYLLIGFSENSRHRAETWAHRLIEPSLVALAAWIVGGLLGLILSVMAASLLLKEWINAWFQLRSEKSKEDMLDDAKERLNPNAGGEPKPLGSRGRVDEAPIQRIRNDGNS